MSKKFKHFIVEMPGEVHKEGKYSFKDNPELCAEHKQLTVGQRLYIIDPNLIDNLSNTHAKIPVECCYVEEDPRYPRCLWYYFRAVVDEELNTLSDPKFNYPYYKILESTSPYIIIV